ncbi:MULTISPECIES: TetR/AcrR family transcriptional regulator [Kocuria]|uniref:TetR/AcrR family transcriptional regulator n=1 Tax=Kocuria subflava TaxID=1736139 RepID=A0A846TT33_9MICC|nr:TetR/AcrR family transcriptional regulator [Kocuria sp. CPCC 104605]NKE09959.1 TetR/AcrR family transcriptional regulator [Kocuria subflava]
MNTSTTQLGLRSRDAKERTDGRSRRWRLHREKRRTELLKLARTAIAECGATASMSEIASHCRTSKSVFYRYFEDKDGLKRELGEYVVARMGRRMAEAVAEAGSFQETVRALVTQYLEQIEHSPEVYLFVVSENAPAEESPVDRFCQAVAELLVNAHRQHAPAELHIPEATARYWAAGVVGLVRGAGEAWMLPRNGADTQPREAAGPAAPETSAAPETERPSLEQFVETVTTWVVSGSRPPEAR